MTAVEAVSFVLDGEPVTLAAGAPAVLADALRHGAGRSSVRVACDQGVCGTCTVLLDGVPVTACSTLTETVPRQNRHHASGPAPKRGWSHRRAARLR